MRRPSDMFDREYEWKALAGFVSDETPGATLGIVSGRRRQGKSFLLESLCEAAGGFYFAATEGTEAENLRRFGDELAQHLKAPGPFAYDTWDAGIDAILKLGQDHTKTVVIDEFPFLCNATPSLPSIIQKAYGPRRNERVRSRTRLLLCGSALSFMGGLLSGGAPLRGRAGLDLTVHTFDYRQAAEFWDMADSHTAAKLHAIVGGTPAYRREYVRSDTPTDPQDFDAWVTRTVLDPSCPLFKEARYLLAEEAELRDRALYHSVLAAVTEGNATRGAIASYVGRPADTLRHPLTVLEDAGFLTNEPDAFRHGRSFFRITEPLVVFYNAIMRPEWSELERHRNGGEIWEQSAERFSTLVLGPHFEHLSRVWVRDHAPPGFLNEPPRLVLSGVINDPHARRTHEIDIAAFGRGNRTKPLLAIGEVKWGLVMGTDHLNRLEFLRELLQQRDDLNTNDTKLLCVSGAGFSTALRKAADTRNDIELVDTNILYRKS